MNESGEGVISSAIAVLVTAFLGAAMWLVFSNIVSDSAGQDCQQVTQTASVGQDNTIDVADC